MDEGYASPADPPRAVPLAKAMRLGAPEVYEAYGVRFALRTAETWVMIGAREMLPCTWTRVPDAGSDGLVCYTLRRRPDGFYWHLCRGRTVVVETRSLARALHALRGKLVEWVGKHSAEFAFVHSGAVVWKGRGILLPGDSFAGKSTLVSALLSAGATYYSDELALLDDTGRLHAYPRPLQLCDPDRSEALVEDDGGLREPVPVAMVVFSQFVIQRPWRLELLTAGMAVALGLRYTFSARQLPARAMQAWSAAVEGAIAWSWKRGDARQAAGLLLQALDRESAAPQ